MAESQAARLGPTEPIDEHAIECLDTTKATSFTAEPATLQPFAGGATLRWSVTTLAGCRVTVTLNGRPVARSGSQQVQPTTTTRYTLGARMHRVSRVLKSVVVQVDTSACVSGSVPEDSVRSAIEGAVDQLDRSSGRVSQRSSPRVEVEVDGIHVGLRFKVSIDDFADPDLDVDFTVGLRVRNGSAEAFYRSFAVDVDWPWWVTAITAGVSKIVEGFIEDEIEGRLKPMILTAVQAEVDELVDGIPGDLRLHAIRPAANEIGVTVCPAGRDVPFLVV